MLNSEYEIIERTMDLISIGENPAEDAQVVEACDRLVCNLSQVQASVASLFEWDGGYDE